MRKMLASKRERRQLFFGVSYFELSEVGSVLLIVGKFLKISELYIICNKKERFFGNSLKIFFRIFQKCENYDFYNFLVYFYVNKKFKFESITTTFSVGVLNHSSALNFSHSCPQDFGF